MTALVTSPKAAALAGITYRQLDYWTRSGKVTPTIEAHGRGTPRGWSYEDVQRLITLKKELTP